MVMPEDMFFLYVSATCEYDTCAQICEESGLYSHVCTCGQDYDVNKEHLQLCSVKDTQVNTTGQIQWQISRA